MAFRSNFSVVLFFSHLLLLFSSKICRASESHDCPTSSCGSISNISYPFRLKDDPENCGDSSYELVCENNRTTIYLNFKRFFVQSITYENFTIRLVDPGLAEYQGYSCCPLHYLTYPDLYLHGSYEMRIFNSQSLMYPYLNKFLISVSCLSHLNTTFYYDTAFCSDRKNILSSSPPSTQENHSYCFLRDSVRVADIEDSCSVKRVTMVSPNAPVVGNSRKLNYSYGFELRWRSYLVVVHCTFGRPSTLHPSFKCLKQLLIEIWWLCQAFCFYLAKIMWLCRDFYQTVFTLTGLILGARFCLGILCLFVFLGFKMRRKHLSMYENIENFLQGHNNLVPIRYTYAEVKKMTNNFKDKLGEGGYGTVFKGKLRSGLLVAVKMMGKSKANGEEFISEVATIGRIHHVNVVNLIGFCFQGSKRALVYEFMPNGSLERYIFPQDGEMKSSSWEKMFRISLGVARGMDYLHRGCEMQILHFDIKPHNILLDESFNPKISDFGLAKLYPVDNSIVSLTAARGTMGYMAPELFYKNIGRVSYKADVYSFGMLLMEMAGKRKNLNPFVDHLSQIYFPSWAHDQFSQGKEFEMGDATEDERKIVKKMILVALWCIQMKPTDRPSMNKVVEMLEGDLNLLEMPPKPFLSPEGMQDNSNHEINANNDELPLLSTIYRDSGTLDVEM